jgi:glucokinase
MSALIADCGGTFSRFAWLSEGVIYPLVKLRNAEFAHFKAVVAAALALCPTPPNHAALAISGTDNRENISFTNNGFYASRQELMQLGLAQVNLMNDFVPLSLALANLEALKLQFLDNRPHQQGHRLVVGVGTGIGVGALLQVGDKYHALPSEGGHVYFEGVSPLEKEVIKHIAAPITYIETLLSGEGFLRIYTAICAIEGHKNGGDYTSESLVASLAVNPQAQQAARLFWDILARACDNFALTFLTHGGVYLTGGMCERLKDYLNPARFRAIFTQKPHYHTLLDKMPIGLIGAPDPAFLGLQAFIEKRTQFI